VKHRSGPNRPALGSPTRPTAKDPAATLRIIGGTLRGRKLQYSGDVRTRPMKDRVREAIFNLLGPRVKGKHALDLFAGTGALGLEALSRGAARATLIERHFPTAKLIGQNAAELGVEASCEVVAADAFYWVQRQFTPGTEPLVAFISPPYDFYVERRDDMLAMIGALAARAPADSILVVESDDRFDLGQLPQPDRWDVRRYPPAVVAILKTDKGNHELHESHE
jgi:16S rRNA (guanine966-N2)-methyltransferase